MPRASAPLGIALAALLGLVALAPPAHAASAPDLPGPIQLPGLLPGSGPHESARAEGSFELDESGKLTGTYSAGIVRRDALQVWGYTRLASSTEVFRNVSVTTGPATGASEGERYRSFAREASLSLVDDAFATILVQARETTFATLEPGADLRARGVDDRVVALDGPQGSAGHLILLGEGSSLAADAEGRIRAHLAPGSTLLFRASPARFPLDDALAQGIAAGRVGAQALVHAQGSASTAFDALASAAAHASGDGALLLDYATSDADAQVVALDALGGSLAARGADDVRVLVDGAPAAVAPSVDDVLLLGGGARYHAEAAPDGSLRVLVHVGAADHGARILVESRNLAAQRAWGAGEGLAKELSAAQRAMMREAIAQGHVAGALLVRTDADATIASLEPYSNDVSVAAQATKARLDITLTSAQHEGRTILVALDPRTIAGLARGDAQLLYDGRPAREAASFADVLDATDDGDAAEYLVLAGEETVQVLVSVPHFSVHTVTLQERHDAPNAALMYATIALGVVAAVESILLIRRKKA